MRAALEQNMSDEYVGTEAPVIVVGAGPVGRYFADELLKYGGERHIVVFGDEPYEPYDRVKLSSYLAGETNDIWQPTISKSDHLHRLNGERVISIDRENKHVFNQNGDCWSYSSLVLATGSRPYIPPIHGIDLDNVFSFRDMLDAEKLKARSISSRHTVVVGGGLLGLEAAKAMNRFNTKVTVIEQSMWPMFNQLDESAGQLLKHQITEEGIEVVTNIRVQKIEGDKRVEYLVLTGGNKIHCDTLVIAAGIKPNIDIAKDVDLKTRRGVLVDDSMQTNDPDIYAIGECAEHDSKVYGLVRPGLEQASVLAGVLMGKKARYKGSDLVTRLKVINSPVYSIGETSTEWLRKELVFKDKKNGLLRKIFLQGNRLDAALAVGEWSEFSRIQESVTSKRRIWPWQSARFLKTGKLWPENESEGVAAWPANATVCNCMAVTRGELSNAITKGCRDVRSLAESTNASTVCGSCRPLLQQMLGAIGIEAVRASRLLLVSGIVTLFAIAAFLSLPNISYSDSVQNTWHWDLLWRDTLFKQISGFTLLGRSVVLAFISIPKRYKTKKVSWGQFSSWRAVHVAVGLFVLVALVAHTGLRTGHELNMILMLVFSGLLLAGAVLSGAVGLQHKLPLSLARTMRAWSLWTHIALLWPLPVLLGFHVLKTYWY